MNKKSKNSGLKQKILVTSAIIMLAIVVIISALFIVFLNSEFNSEVNSARNDFDSNIKNAVETIISALQADYQRYTDGTISQDEAMETAKTIVRDARYNSGAPGASGDGYFWADMADGLCAVHYNPANEGAMRWDSQDQEGTYYVRNFIKNGDSGGGYSDFYFGKPGDENGSYQKRAYTEKFAPYGWYISTGNYFEDTDKIIKGIRDTQTRDIIILLVASLLAVIIGVFVLSKNIDNIVKLIRNLVGNIENSTNRINTEISNLAGSSGQLASGSSKQAASIEETSATMNETASMVAQNAENTRLAAQIAADATETANKGMKEMTDMIKAMNELKDSSDKVGKIVKTIDDIAFQTNLLAINATVEAARAGGDAGRSFSVVAV
ncbi:MAG: cache domain-containing protein, partial [Oscillospiraceae bacterium]|nr:cache domain-containing protein [Oscillospiraceae bacterium]